MITKKKIILVLFCVIALTASIFLANGIYKYYHPVTYVLSKDETQWTVHKANCRLVENKEKLIAVTETEPKTMNMLIKGPYRRCVLCKPPEPSKNGVKKYYEACIKEKQHLDSRNNISSEDKKRVEELIVMIDEAKMYMDNW